MAKQLSNGKWTPIIWTTCGHVEMKDLINGKWDVVECNTKEEAEQKEDEYDNWLESLKG